MSMENRAMNERARTSRARARGAGRRATAPAAAAACGWLLLLATGAGCDKFMQQGKCPALSDCGGNVPIGTWILAPGHGSCTEDIYVAPTDPRLPMGSVPAARTPGPEPALYDWCDLLVTSANQDIIAVPANFYTYDIQIGAASVSYNADGTYSAGLTRTGSYFLTFPALCMREFGATDNKPAFDYNANMPTGGPVDICQQLQMPLGQIGLGPGSFRDVQCVPNVPDDPGGCVCKFDATLTGGGAGTFLTQQSSPTLDFNQIVNLPGKDFPQDVTYCNTGTGLELTGRNGEDLFGTLGLKTLDLISAK
jgi:hypothetical protein